jgi:hypothetical protein
MPPAELARAAAVSSGVVKALIDEGVLAVEQLLPDERVRAARPVAPRRRAERQPGGGAPRR